MKRDMAQMKPLRIYIDTSVLGGCFDVEFAEWSNGLIGDFRAGRLVPVLSDVTAAEVADAPPLVRELHQEMLVLAGLVLAITPQVLDLVTAYEARKILSPKYAADMRHIALATVTAVDSLVSWNFKHIVRLEKIRLFNAVNVESGYQSLNILSPREVTTHERT
jgi:hypothetical protein